jgi:hypothetical protein
MRQITVNLRDDQVTALQKRAAETGVLQSEIIRRALDVALSSETVRPAAPRSASAPVLISPKASA